MAKYRCQEHFDKWISLVEEPLDRNDFKEVYEILVKDLSPAELGNFTLFLLNNGINPLEHLNYVPERFLFTQDDQRGPMIYDIVIPQNIKDIGNSAFEYSGIKTVTFEGQLKTIGIGAFRNCEDLEVADLSKGVEVIQDGAFYKCKKVIVPNTVKYIGKLGLPYNVETSEVVYLGSKKEWRELKAKSILNWNRYEYQYWRSEKYVKFKN